MALDDLLISTGVDNLIKLVHERGRVELKAAAAELHLPVQTVEDWSRVLEAEGIVKIQYQLTQVYLAWASMSPQEFSKTTKAVEVKKSQTVQKLQNLEQTVGQNLGELDQMKTEYGQLKEKTKREMDTLGADQSEAVRMGAQIDSVVEAKRARLLELKGELENFHGELEQFDVAFRKKSAGGKEGGPDLAAQMESLGKMEEKLNGRMQNFGQQFDALQAQIQDISAKLGDDKSERQLGEVKTSLDDLKFARTEMAKTLATLADEVKSLGSELNGLAAQVSEVESKKGAAGVNPKKLAAVLDTLSRQAARERESMLSELAKNLEVVRKQMQAYSQSQYQYQNIKSRLENLQAQYNKEGEELEQFLEALEEAQKRYTSDIASAKAELGGQQKDYAQLMEQARKVESVLGQIDALKIEGENLSLKLKGVLKEAEVVAMAAPSGRGGSSSSAGEGESYSPASDTSAYGARGGAGAASGSQAAGRSGVGGASGAGGSRAAVPGYGQKPGRSSPMGGPQGAARPGPINPAGAYGGAVAGVGAAGGNESMPPELAQKIALTTAEEEQFEKKRNELRGLIRKMWDEDRKPPNA